MNGESTSRSGAEFCVFVRSSLFCAILRESHAGFLLLGVFIEMSSIFQSSTFKILQSWHNTTTASNITNNTSHIIRFGPGSNVRVVDFIYSFKPPHPLKKPHKYSHQGITNFPPTHHQKRDERTKTQNLAPDRLVDPPFIHKHRSKTPKQLSTYRM